MNFYPRSPCGERLGALDSNINPQPISIHALLAESDPEEDMILDEQIISIHALLAESDVSFMLYDTSSLIFLSTLSLRRATVGLSSCSARIIFLSTLSLRRATKRANQLEHCEQYFYPRSPCGERLMISLLVSMSC